MKLMSIENHLRRLIPETTNKFPSIQVLYLFGSHASGTAGTDSDVDIAVFTDGSDSPMMDLELGVFLQKRLNRAVDVVIMQKASPILQHEVLSQKERIFEKAPTVRALLENQSLRAYLDARYYQRKRAFWRNLYGQNRRHSTVVE